MVGYKLKKWVYRFGFDRKPKTQPINFFYKNFSQVLWYIRAVLVEWLKLALISRLRLACCLRVIVLSLRLLYNRQQNWYQLSLRIKQHRLIECLANNHKSSCVMSYPYKKGDERIFLSQIGTE